MIEGSLLADVCWFDIVSRASPGKESRISSAPATFPMISTMSDTMAFLLFGDQSLGVHGFLADFYQHGNPSVLSLSFLEQVGAALREEVDQMSSIERQRVPQFSSIKDLNENYQVRKIKNSAVDSVLLCITQLVHYIE